jgi:hypothetical protein
MLVNLSMRDNDIVEAGRAIRPYLKELIPEDAEAVDQELAKYVDEPQTTGASSAKAILAILRKREPTRTWLAKMLATSESREFPTSVTRSFEPPPGRPDAVSARKYVCPQGDMVWYRMSAGSPIPKCTKHGVTLVPEP